MQTAKSTPRCNWCGAHQRGCAIWLYICSAICVPINSIMPGELVTSSMWHTYVHVIGFGNFGDDVQLYLHFFLFDYIEYPTESQLQINNICVYLWKSIVLCTGHSMSLSYRSHQLDGQQLPTYFVLALWMHCMVKITKTSNKMFCTTADQHKSPKKIHFQFEKLQIILNGPHGVYSFEPVKF